MVSRLINSDPKLAHEHALAAVATAARVGVVRETAGVTAYLTGDYALALRELQTFRRISGSEENIALMIDAERGLGRLDRALELAKSVDTSKLSAEARVNHAIAYSGVRLDLDDLDGALLVLQIPELDETKAFDYSPDLFTAYANVLSDLGQEEAAEKWQKLAALALQALVEDDDYMEIVEERPAFKDRFREEREPEADGSVGDESDAESDRTETVVATEDEAAKPAAEEEPENLVNPEDPA